MSTAETIQTERWHEDTARYEFDFKRCRSQDGWAQIDTAQDAWYFGQWANPSKFQIFCYSEGDCCMTTASSPEEFTAEIRRMAKWSIDAGWGFKIDGMCQDPIIKAFQSLGLNDLLH